MFGGGVHASSVTTISDSVIGGNATSGDGGGVYIDISADAQITGTLIQGNSATSSGGGIYSIGKTHVEDSSITGNASGLGGGGLYVDYGSFQGSGLDISGNRAGSSGGGLNISSEAWSTTLTDSTIAGNTAAGGAGGLHARAGTFERLAILDNTADASNDGGALITGTASLYYTTIAGNTAATTGGIAIYGGGGGYNLTITGNSIAGSGASGAYVDSDTQLFGSIIAGNQGGVDVFGPNLAPGDFRNNIYGTAIDPSYGAENQSGVSPDALFAQVVDGAGAVADNGGGVLTVALLDDASNPALDVFTGESADARGYTAFGLRDVGAFELHGVAPVPTVDTVISTVAVHEDSDVLWTVPADAFAGGNGALTLSADGGEGVALPAWLAFDPATGTFSGKPPADFDGEVELRVIATDAAFASVSQTFTLDVLPVNDAPVAADHAVQTTDATPISIDLASLVTDVDGDPVWITQIDGGFVSFHDPHHAPLPGPVEVILKSGATLTGSMDGPWLYTPSAKAALLAGAANGTAAETFTDSFTFASHDWWGPSNTATVTVTVVGDASNDDVVRGFGDSDVLFGRGGADHLRGGGGDDVLTGNGGDDRLLGGRGADELHGHTGADTLVGGRGADLLMGGSGADTLLGGSGDDLLRGAQDDDTLHGHRGADTLRGGAGSDALSGDRGRDRLIGGEGDDALAGGGGRDTFVFAGAFGTDTVSDCSLGRDRIDLSAAKIDLGALAIAQHGDDTVIEVAAGATVGTIVLQDTDMQDLSASDFLF